MKLSRGFTLLEILLTVAILAILSAVTLSAINPIRQMAQARDSQRKSDVSEIHKAVQQYFIDKGIYPAEVASDTQVYNICSSPVYIPGNSGIAACGDLVNIARVLPVYLNGIPIDPTASKLGIDTLYRVAVNKVSGVYVEAPKTEIAQGLEKKVIYVGKPPRGYVIPTLDNQVATSTASTFISYISNATVSLPAWVNQLIIGIVGIVIGYMFGANKKRK